MAKPWDVRLCKRVAYHGQLEALQYIHQTGCPWEPGLWMS
jgi:hypothetical protein